MVPDRRHFLQVGGLALAGALAGCGQQQGTETPTEPSTETADGTPGGPSAVAEVTVTQEAGNTVYWVLPGERRLSPSVFGTPDAPRFGADYLAARVEEAKELPSPLDDAIPQLLEDLPPLVAAPEKARATVDDEIAHETFTEPTLFSDEGKVTSGEFEVVYGDARPYDLPGKPGETPDSAEFTAQFTDPNENTYEIEFDHVVQPPLPGYETAGGVMVDAWHHGTTATGSPLMPQVYTYGAFWGVGNVTVDGTTDERKVVHVMTTQTVRDSDYRLALDEELPLEPDETIAGNAHHTHVVVLPITATDEGPKHEPVQTAFELPNGKNQPFIHAMFEQETITKHPFAGWSPDDGTTGEARRQVQVRQKPGKTFYWVVPGPRRISERVFGTPDAPRFGTDLLQFRIEQAKRLPEPLNEAIPQLLQDLPILVALPEEARQTDEDGTAFTKTKIATPFPDKGIPTSGQFEVTYRDARPYDLPGKPGETPDSVELETTFTDPDDNTYEIEFDHVVQPPIPGYETASGVMVDARHHGVTGTGSPLMPQVYTYGAFWGVGNVIVNGEPDERKVMHMMTTQNVRDKEYRLALGEELPLSKQDTIGNQVHHTHLIVFPITATDEGPKFQPVQTAFELPNGETQPFIHAMFEQDTIVEHPFKDWPVDGE